MAWDQQGYYQDPYQQYGVDQSYGYDPYGYGYQAQPEEDTESQKLRKDQEEKERQEAMESNRLYLKKVKKQCAKEDFADLDKLQLFLFEVLVETLEVNCDSVLGLVKNDQENMTITARVQFFNSPYLEISERDVIQTRASNAEENYFKTIGQNGPYYSNKNQDQARNPTEEPQAVEEERQELKFTTKWANASGKSCLFAQTALLTVQDLERFPVNLHVIQSVASDSDEETCEETLGYSQLWLPEDFSLSVLQSCKADVILPVSSEYRDTLDIKNVFGVKKGKVELFLRLSAFGPVIITSFQASGPDRKYVFKPSPFSSNFKMPKEQEDLPRTDLLKPLIAEEEGTYGISVQKEYDMFQKPVLWKTSDPFNRGCLVGNGNLEASRQLSLQSLRLPIASNISLCKNVLPPSMYRKLKFEKETCDWHNLVSSEIKNSPGGNCGCLDASKTNPEKSFPTVTMQSKESRRRTNSSTVSRLRKIVKPMKKEPEKQDCNCNCPYIKDALNNKKLFMI